MGAINNLPGVVLNRAHPISRGLTGWWGLNEMAGQVAQNSVTPANNGVCATSVWGGGVLGASWVGNGVYRNLDCGSAYRYAYTQDVTLCAWVNVFSTSANYPFIAGQFATGSGRFQYYLLLTGPSNKLTFEVSRAGTASYSALADTTPGLNTWYFLAGVYRSQVVSLYVNGQLQSTTATLAGTPNVPDKNFFIGCDGGGSNNATWNGSIAHVRVYNRALTADEVRVLYSNPMAGAIPSRVTRWMLSGIPWPMRYQQLKGVQRPIGGLR